MQHAANQENTRHALGDVKKRVPVMRMMVETFIRLRGAHGATDEEIARALRMNPNTARPRRVELWEEGKICALIDHNLGQVVRRKTASGASATVWITRD